MTQLNKNKKLIIIGSIFAIIFIIFVSAILTLFKDKNTTVVKVQSVSESIAIKEPKASISPELKSHNDLPLLEDIKPEVNLAKKYEDASIKKNVPDSSQPIIISNENKQSSEPSILKSDESSFASISDSEPEKSGAEILENNPISTNEIKSKETKKTEKALPLPLQQTLQTENVNESLEKPEIDQSALPEPIKTTGIHEINYEDKNKNYAQDTQKQPQTNMEESEENASNPKDENSLELEETKKPKNEVNPQILAESLLGESKSNETQNNIAKKDIPSELGASQLTQEIQSLDTDSVKNKNNSLNSFIIKSINHFDCGNNNHIKICGSFEIHNLPKPLNQFPTMKVFFAVKAVKIIQDIASEISDYDTQEPFDPSSISKFISDDNGTTCYYSKDQDIDNLTLEIILDQIKKSNFITFFNSLKFEDRNIWDEKNLFVIIPENLETLEKYSLTETNWITTEQLSKSSSTKPEINPLKVVDFKKGGYFLTTKYKLNTKIITNLFGQEGLKALSIEFDTANKNDSQFNSLDKYNSFHPNNRRITFSGLNIMHNYEYNDREIITVLKNIKAKGLENEINEQLKQQNIKPFSILLIGSGSEKYFNEFQKLMNIYTKRNKIN